MNSCVVKNIILVSKNGTEKKLTLENDKNSQQYLPVMFSIIYIYIYIVEMENRLVVAWD